MDDALTDNTEPKHCGLRPWRPGESGNPKGRPRGSRGKLASAFVDDLYRAWLDHGAEVIERVRVEDPATFLKTVAQILPKEFEVTHTAFADVTSIVQAHRLALAIVRGDIDVVREHAPLIEHDDG
jgi:hypothetical protein